MKWGTNTMQNAPIPPMQAPYKNAPKAPLGQTPRKSNIEKIFCGRNRERMKEYGQQTEREERRTKDGSEVERFMCQNREKGICIRKRENGS